jgi:hypothetical protein
MRIVTLASVGGTIQSFEKVLGQAAEKDVAVEVQ